MAEATATYSIKEPTPPPVEFTLNLTDRSQVAVLYALVNENYLYKVAPGDREFREAKDAIYNALYRAGVNETNTPPLHHFKNILRKASKS